MAVTSQRFRREHCTARRHHDKEAADLPRFSVACQYAKRSVGEKPSEHADLLSELPRQVRPVREDELIRSRETTTGSCESLRLMLIPRTIGKRSTRAMPVRRKNRKRSFVLPPRFLPIDTTKRLQRFGHQGLE